jgi:hypothetical protein
MSGDTLCSVALIYVACWSGQVTPIPYYGKHPTSTGPCQSLSKDQRLGLGPGFKSLITDIVKVDSPKHEQCRGS